MEVSSRLLDMAVRQRQSGSGSGQGSGTVKKVLALSRALPEVAAWSGAASGSAGGSLLALVVQGLGLGSDHADGPMYNTFRKLHSGS
jgi:hypothetical protein